MPKLACKVPKLPKAVTKGVKTFKEKKGANEGMEWVNTVYAYLADHTEEAKLVCQMCEEGAFADKPELEEKLIIPESRICLGLLSYKFLKVLLQELYPQGLNEQNLRSVEKKRIGSSLNVLFCLQHARGRSCAHPRRQRLHRLLQDHSLQAGV